MSAFPPAPPRSESPIHHPNPFGLAVKLIRSRCGSQRGLVRSVARHDLVGQRKPLGSHYQCNDHLHTVRALVSAVTIFALVCRGKGRVTFEIGARQVVQQHLEFHSKEIFPPAPQMLKELFPMLQHFIQTAIEVVLLEPG